MANTSIVTYNVNKINSYQFSLTNILDQIRKIDKVHSEFLSGNWDANIKYRSSFDRSLQELQPKYYQEKGKWVDFVFTTKYFNSDIISLLVFSTESLSQGKMRLILLLF